MKRIIIGTTFLLVTVISFCQQTTTFKAHNREYYLKKSKSQKRSAWVLLGSGSGLIIIGLLIVPGKELYAIGDAAVKEGIQITGALLILPAIPLFIISGRNKRKANQVTTSFQFEKIQTIQQKGLSYRSYYPALSVKINL